jgi:hypothetical protein
MVSGLKGSCIRKEEIIYISANKYPEILSGLFSPSKKINGGI